MPGYVETRPFGPDEHRVRVGSVVVIAAAVVLWDRRAKVHLVAEAADVSGTDLEHEWAIERWAQDGRTVPPPEHPASQALQNVEVQLVVGGLPAVRSGASYGGSASEWEAAVGFTFDRHVSGAPVDLRLTERTTK